MSSFTVAGCDCGKDSLHICILDQVPRNLKSYARSYKPIIVKATAEGLQQLLALNVDLFVLEPTGDYSRIWLENLAKAEKEVRLVSPRRVRHYCEYHGLTNKADRPDAAAIACYTLEKRDDPQSFLKTDRIRIREIVLRLNTIRRDKNPFQNQIGQLLSHEQPAMVKTFETADREWLEEKPPALWRMIAGEDMTGSRSDKMTVSKWANRLTDDIGTGLSSYTRQMAQQLCNLERVEYALEFELAEELARPEYEAYSRIFDRYVVPNKIRGVILAVIYPFEDFLQDGKPVIEYVNGANTRRRSGMTKRDRSEAEFKLSLGMGKILFQSGGSTSWKASGARYARTAIWQYIKVKVVIQRSTKGQSASFTDWVGRLERQLRTEGVPPWLNQALVEAVAEEQKIPAELASLRLHYEYQIDKTGDRRISSTGGRFCRMLYKSLLSEFKK